MYRLFVDDSGSKDYINSFSWDTKNTLPEWGDEHKKFLDDNFFILYGLHIDTDAIAPIDKAIKDLKKRYFGTEYVEIRSVYLYLAGAGLFLFSRFFVESAT